MTSLPGKPTIWAVVPIKRLDEAKTRLSPALSAEARAALALAMASDVIAALATSAAFAGIIVVTSDAMAATAARHAGCVVLAEGADDGLGAAFQAGLGEAQRRGASFAAYVPGDVPLLTAAAVHEIAARMLAAPPPITAIAPCAQGTGTNLLAAAPGDFPPLSFGPHSFARHVAAAPRPIVEIREPGLSFDVDRPGDLALLRAQLAASGATAPQTKAWCAAHPSTNIEAHALAEESAKEVKPVARAVRDQHYGKRITFSKKVFIPLTHLCRDSCAYCVFAQAPANVASAFMEIEEAVAVAAAGARLGCKEALLTLGEAPEKRYTVAREWLDARGFSDTPSYVAKVAEAIRDRTGLLPHINMGVLAPDELARLRDVSASMGAMMENLAPRLAERGGPHFGSPDKQPAALLQLLEDTGRARVPFTTGLLVGIGETRGERIDTLLGIADAHRRHGHIQEVIIQNFLPKAETRWRNLPPADEEELLWTIATARLLLPPEISLQAPPNLNGGRLGALVDAGINDWGGVSPLTPDYINPEKPWPSLNALHRASDAAGMRLTERLTIYPDYIRNHERWVSPKMRRHVLAQCDARLLARENDWIAGRSTAAPQPGTLASSRTEIGELLDEIESRGASRLPEAEIARLFEADDADYERLCALADGERKRLVGDVTTFIINRNINYTNICSYHCSFCAFSKGDRKHPGGEAPYLLDFNEIATRTREARAKGATEVCLQGGIHPQFTGETYLNICKTVREADPDMHIHAFSPLEVTHGARTLGLPLDTFLRDLKAAGLGTLPGTAAEILHDPVRDIICPDKLRTTEWLEVIETAHRQGLRTTATIMFGHVDHYRDWAIHLAHIRDLQSRTGGFTEFVPLAFVAHEAPMFRKGHARPGPTFREAMLMHAVSRLVLSPGIANIQASWVKMGPAGVVKCLQAGANDLGGVLMNESITRAAGATHGQEMTVENLGNLAAAAGRVLQRRSTTYGRFESYSSAAA
jgi:FO synthase